MGRGRKTHYLVKWKGYPTGDNSWEPEKNLKADELITEFKRSFRPKKTKGKKVFIRAGQTTHIDSSPSCLYHNILLILKEMSSESAASLHVPSTSPVRASSLPPSSAPSTSPSSDIEVPVDYKYIGADYCGICCLPLQYDHICWSQGLIDGYTCRCGRSSSETSPPEPTPEEVPTPQLACRTLPMPESNNDEDSEVNYEDPEESNQENQPLVPPPGYITNNPEHPFYYHIYVRNPLYRANQGDWTHKRLIMAPLIKYSTDYTMVTGSAGRGIETHSCPVQIDRRVPTHHPMTPLK